MNVTSESATPAPAAPEAPPATPPPTRGWALALSLLVCLAVTIGLWLQTRHELAALRAGQQALAAELDAVRGTPELDMAGAPSMGSADAPVTLIEFADYECPFCIRHFTETMPQIEANDIRAGKVRYIFRDFPIDSLHPGAIRAHEAAHCAAEQGKFWALHARLFSPPGTHTDANLEAKAREAGLAMPEFKACLASGRTTAAVRQSVADITRLGATGTPTFLVGVRKAGTDRVRILKAIAGAQPYAEFEQTLAAVAAQAASTVSGR
jgi:protein-disulfide isomerase